MAAFVEKRKALKKAGMRALRRRLKAIWPHLFSRDDIPLAVGIRHDIARHLTESERQWLPAVLHQHVHRPRYLAALQQPGACRVDLQGNLTPVSPEHAASASRYPCARFSNFPAAPLLPPVIGLASLISRVRNLA